MLGKHNTRRLSKAAHSLIVCGVIRLWLVGRGACLWLLALLDCHLHPALTRNTGCCRLGRRFSFPALRWDRAFSSRSRGCVFNGAGGWGSRVNVDVSGHLYLTGEEAGLLAVDRRSRGVLIQVLIHGGERDLTHLCLIQCCDSLRVQQHLYHRFELGDVVF